LDAEVENVVFAVCMQHEHEVHGNADIPFDKTIRSEYIAHDLTGAYMV
jgi:hypothetical protein